MNTICKDCGYEDLTEKFIVEDDPDFKECPECRSDNLDEDVD